MSFHTKVKIIGILKLAVGLRKEPGFILNRVAYEEVLKTHPKRFKAVNALAILN